MPKLEATSMRVTTLFLLHVLALWSGAHAIPASGHSAAVVAQQEAHEESDDIYKKRCREGKHVGMDMDKAACQASCKATSGCTHAIHFDDNGCQIAEGCTLVKHSYPGVMTDEIFEMDKPLGEDKKLKIYSVLDEKCDQYIRGDCGYKREHKRKVRNGCGLEFDNNWMNGWTKRERKATWVCPPVDKKFSSKDADPIWFEPAPKWPMVRVYVRDHQGRKCGLEWESNWFPYYGYRKAKFDCKGNADPIKMVEVTEEDEEEKRLYDRDYRKLATIATMKDADQLNWQKHADDNWYMKDMIDKSWGFFHIMSIDGSSNNCYLKVTSISSWAVDSNFMQRQYSRKGEVEAGVREAYWSCRFGRKHADAVMVVPAEVPK